VHRIGRTGRAGASGEALSLVCADERKLLAGIEKLLKRAVEKRVVPGFEPDPNEKPEPIEAGRGQQRRGPRPAGQGGGRPGQGARPRRNGPSRSRRPE
jgi:ATP-dependent RNA helicase RhlE